MSRLSDAIRSWRLRKGKKLVKTTPYETLLEFMRSVRPIDFGPDLVRIGGAGDGGYLVPNDLEGIQACFSPGVSTIANFELELAGRGIPCFMADASVPNMPVDHPLFNFEPKFLGPITQGHFISLGDWIDSKEWAHSAELLLQMDIEGAEYSVLSECGRDRLRQFRILIIEFHHLDRLVEANVFPFIKTVFDLICADFDVVHIHPNNNDPMVNYQGLEIPHTMEFSFLRKDRESPVKKDLVFPHPLDRLNNPEKPDLPLPACWYSHQC